MTWQTRTRDAAYVSPSGARFTFAFLRADREFDKNTTAFNFPGVPGTYIQDLESTDDRYPMRAIFWGDNHDLQATAFLNALRETGKGRLEHPRDGLVTVVPFGKIKTREDLVRDANQTIIEVEFWETTIILFPTGTTDPGSNVLGAVGETLTALSSVFAETIDIVSAVNRASIRNRFGTSVGVVRSILGTITSVDPDAFREFNTVADSIISDLDALIFIPEVLADQLNVLTQIPAKSTATIGAKFDGYTALTEQFTSFDNPDDRLRSTVNDFRNDELFSVSSLSGLISSSINTTFSTRSEAVTAAVEITDQFKIVNEWREVNYAGLA